jgi:Flp pilus assembly protein TadD
MLLAVVALASLGANCAHSRGAGGHRFIHGNVPDYEATWRELNKEPEESLQRFIARVRRLAAEARPTRAMQPSVEQFDPVLRQALAELGLAPTAANHRRVAARYRRLGVHDQAYDHLAEAVKIAPRDAAAWDDLARALRDWGFPQYALGDAHRAVFFAPAEAAYRNTLGTILQALGRRTEARAAYQAALARQPGAPWALNNLCVLSIAAGEHARAVGECQAALRGAPGFREARANLALAVESARTPPAAAPTPAAPRPDVPARAAAGETENRNLKSEN